MKSRNLFLKIYRKVDEILTKPFKNQYYTKDGYFLTPLYVAKYTINIIEICNTPLLNTGNNLLRWLKIFEVLILHRNSGVS